MSELKINFNFADRLAGLQRNIPISQAKKCIVFKNNILTKEHSIPKMKLFIPLFIGSLYGSLFTVSYQQGDKV